MRRELRLLAPFGRSAVEAQFLRRSVAPSVMITVPARALVLVTLQPEDQRSGSPSCDSRSVMNRFPTAMSSSMPGC